MRWLAIKRKDGEVDEYAIAFATHTVSKALVDGEPVYTAWRLRKEPPGEILGTADTAAGAKLMVEEDAKRGR